MNNSLTKSIKDDLLAGLVVFFVALPLCLGVALASNAPLFSGILAGIIGGIIVGMLSGSSTSVSGPAAGLAAVVASQIQSLGSFEIFLAAVLVAGVIQIIFSISQLGFIALFFPSSVIKGLLAAIGILLILKQIPHVLGRDEDPIGSSTFLQMDDYNTLSTLFHTLFDFHYGAAVIGLLSLGFLLLWDRVPALKNSLVPSPVIVVLLGMLLAYLFEAGSDTWALQSAHFVQVPVAKTLKETFSFFIFPDFSLWNKLEFYMAAVTIAAVASLETLLNLEAIDKIDPLQRASPPNRELLAQGAGNLLAGFLGALPITSVIVRSSVNVNAGGKTKISTVWHGILLFGSVLFIPTLLNKIPLASLAAILLVTGIKLASPQIIMQMWREGRYQFLPFIFTVLAIVFTDLLIGVLIGLATAIWFILQSNIRRPIKKIMEKHATGDEVLHIELPNQVSFFNRAALEASLYKIPRGGHVLIDATTTDYIDPDILDLIHDFQNKTAKSHGVRVSLAGFKDKYPRLEDRIQYVDFSTREMQEHLTPRRVLEVLYDGNQRFREGVRLTRNLNRQLSATAVGQFPMAVVLSCIDSRAPIEIVFDLSLGDVFSVRIAGNVVSPEVLGSMEYSCAIAGAKLILVLGHTSCGAVKASVDLITNHKTAEEITGCKNLDCLIVKIQKAINGSGKSFTELPDEQKTEYYNEVAYRNVMQTIQEIRKNSATLDKLVREGVIAIAGGMYDVSTGEVSFFESIESHGNRVTGKPETNKDSNSKSLKVKVRNFLSKWNI